MRYTYEELLANPDLIAEVHRAARRERAAVVSELVIEPVKRLLAGDPARERGAAPLAAKAHC